MKDYTIVDAEQSTGETSETDSMNERQYTRFIVDALCKGITPAFIPARAGTFADMLDILIQDCVNDGFDYFPQVLEASKNKHAALKIVLEETVAPASDVAPLDPSFTMSDKGKKVFKQLTVTDVWSLPDIDWLVSGILQRATTTLVVGTGNVGKTFVWLDVCFDIAYGQKWLGRRTQQGRVLYIYAEGSGGLKQRMKAWMIENGKATLDGITEPTDQISFIVRPVNLLNDRQTLIDTIEESHETHGNYPEEVVIDTFSMCSGGVDENSNSEVAKYLETAAYIKLTYKCHVTIIHHTNKSGGFRGASALRDNVDTMIMLDREDDNEGPIKVKCGKQRDGEFFKPFSLNLKVVGLGINHYTNEPITSCVVELDDGEEGGTSAPAAMPEKQTRMLDILKIHGSLTSSVWQKRCLEESDIAKTTFNRNLDVLVSSGKVKKTEYMSGKQARVSYSLPDATDACGGDNE